MRAAKIIAVIGHQTVQRQIDLPDQDAGAERIGDAPHLGDHVVDLGLVGGIARQDLLVRRPAVVENADWADCREIPRP